MRSLVLAATFACFLAVGSIAQTPPIPFDHLHRHLAPQSDVHQAEPSPVVTLPVAGFKMLSQSTGWAIVNDRILWTTNNGKSWNDISLSVPNPPDPQESKFFDVQFRDAQNGWLTYHIAPNDDTHSGVFLAKTVDSGATWQTVSELPNPYLPPYSPGDIEVASISFADNMHGWADIGGFEGFRLYLTSDGGRTWLRAKGDPGGSFAIVALTARDAFFFGGTRLEPASLLVTHDAGQTISEVTLPNPPEISATYWPTNSLPEFTTTRDGYEVVNYRGPLGSKSAAVVFATHNGGRSWSFDRLVSDLDEDEKLDSGVAESAWIIPFSYDGSTPWLFNVSSNDRKAAPVSETGHHLRSCKASFLTINEGWVYCLGTLYSTTDGGSTWSNITPRARNGVLTTDSLT